MNVSKQAEEIFATAKDLVADKRGAYLTNACGTNARLYREVSSLLTAANESENYFDQLANQFGLFALADDDPAPLVDQEVGPWRLLELIGHGGMGAVYLVERADDQFEQRAALKMLPRGIGSEHDKARFIAERQILARLEHENIARLLDGGVSDDGTPYFVMDYVEGQSIDVYCDQHKLTLEERLRLFLQVCAAISYAHRNLVVHRDIKPGNVLVEVSGRVRLLDFGIAKIVESSNQLSNLTRVAMRPMTPAYASPEMIKGDVVDLTSDVYSLGVLMYVLLAGREPLSFAGLSAADIERKVVNTNPQSLSAAVSMDNSLAIRIAAARRSDARRLRTSLQGDLDTIVAKALAKEKSQRYQTVEHLTRDVDNFLAGRPVEARAPSYTYLARKFVQRHKIGVGFATLLAGLMIAITLMATNFALQTEQQSQQIAAERDRAQEITSFMVSVFQSADPDQPAADMTALQILDQGRQRIVEELTEQPDIQAELLKSMSEVYNGMRLSIETREILGQELALREQLTGPDSAEVADTLIRLAQITDVDGDYESSQSYAEQSLEIANAVGDQHLQAASHIRLGRILHLKGDYAPADTHYRSALRRYQSLYGEENENTAKAMQHLANLLNHQDRYSEALTMFEGILGIYERLYGSEYSEIGPILLGQGQVLSNLDRLDEAEAAFRRAFALNEALFGPDNRRNLYVVGSLGKIAEKRGEFDLAATHHIDAGRLVYKHFGEHGNLGITKANLAKVYCMQEKFAESVPVFREAVAILENKMPDHWYVGDARWRLGYALLKIGQHEEAESNISHGADIMIEKRGLEHELTQEAIAAAIELYTALDKTAEVTNYQDLLIVTD